MSKTATLKGKISMDDSEFQKTLRRAGDRAKKWAKDVASNAASAAASTAKAGLIGLGAAGLGAAGGLLAAAKSAADLGGQLSDASAVTGIAAGKMLVLQQAFANAGMSGEGAAGVIAKLQAAIGRAGFMSEETEEEVSDLRDRISELRDMKAGMDPKEQAKVNKEIAKTQERIGELESEAKGVQKAFQVLGLDRGALAQMDGADQLKAVFEAIGKMGTQADKLAALRMLRLPPELMVLAKDPNAFKGAETLLGSLPGVMNKYADSFDRVSDILGAKFKILFQQVGAGFMASLVDNKTFQALLSKFESLDFSFIGSEIGTRLSGAIDLVSAAIKDGNLGQMLGDALSAGAAAAAGGLVKAMQLAVTVAGAMFDTVMSAEGQSFMMSLGAGLTGVLGIVAFNFGKALKILLMDLEASLGDSTLGRAWSGIKATGAATGFLGAGAANALTLGAFWDETGAMQDEFAKIMGENLLRLYEGPDNAVDMERKRQIMEDDRIPWMGDMSQAEALKETFNQLSQAGGKAAQMTDSFGENLRKRLQNPESQKMTAGVNTGVSASVDAMRGRLRNDEQRNALDRMLYGPGAMSTQIPLNVPQQSPAQSPMQWVFPDGTSNKTKGGGDTGPKQVEVLERVASLLERNLVSLQIA
jgi:hypothetical protein